VIGRIASSLRQGARGLAPVALSMAVLLGGCSSPTGDLQGWAAQVRSHKAGPIPPIPKMVSYQPFAYHVRGRRDPFVPQVQADGQSAQSGPRPDASRPRQPLEQFPLDALSMVGVLDFAGAHYAMIKAPDGVVYRIAVGGYMGQNYGRVTRIESDRVDLQETVPNGFGGWEQRPAVLSMGSR
jgi:Tfp pilus assembly protein PilP